MIKQWIERVKGSLLPILCSLLALLIVALLFLNINSEYRTNMHRALAAQKDTLRDSYLGQARPYKLLPDGEYAIDYVLNRKSGTAIVRLSIPTGDTTYLVTELPDEYRGQERFTKNSWQNH